MKPTNISDEENSPKSERKGLSIMKAGITATASTASMAASGSVDTLDTNSGGKKIKKKKKKVQKELESSPMKGSKKNSKKGIKNSKQEQLDRERMERIRSENPGVAADFIFKTMLERDPRKRRIKPAVDRILDNLASIQETSSDDSDFDPGDKLSKKKGAKDLSDSDDDEDGDGTDGHNDDADGLSSDDDDYANDSKRRKKHDIGLAALFKDENSSMAESSSQDGGYVASNRNRYNQAIGPIMTEGPSNLDRKKLMNVLVCAVCSGNVSYDSDEIIECDSCGISVHENCYGVTGEDSEVDTIVQTTDGRNSSTDGERPVDLTLATASNTTSPMNHHSHRQHSGHTSAIPIIGHRSPTKSSPRKMKTSNETASNASSASTEPWFCDPCKSGLDPSSINPSFDDSLICELCPNSGGIFKMTVTGRWVHVVCALYIPGVAFLDTTRLDGMTLFELPPDKWGSKYCSLCPDDRLGKTGVTILCDAGLCKTNFHVTCGQREGLLLEAQSLNETEMVDPFYAHCKLHSGPDKLAMKRKKDNFQALMAKVRLLRSDLIQSRMSQNGQFGPNLGRMNERSWSKLQIARQKWTERRQQYATRYWRPQSKVPRSLATSSTAVKTLIMKTAYFGASLVHDVDVFQVEALKNPNQGQLLIKQALNRMAPDAPNESVFDLKPRKKMSAQPDFSPEFVAYYFDRSNRIAEMSGKLSELKATNDALKIGEEDHRTRFEAVMKEYESLKNSAIKTREKTRNIWNLLNRMTFNHPMIVSSTTSPTKITLCSKKYYPKVLESPIKVSTVASPSTFKVSKVSKAAPASHSLLKKPNVSKFPATQPAVLKNCGKCSKTADQHLLALCDNCHLYIHLYCLDPPLTRMPKKTRFGGWQCSDCTEKQVELEAEEIANGFLDRRIDGRKASVGGTPTKRDSGQLADDSKRRLRKLPAKFSTPEPTPMASGISPGSSSSKKTTPTKSPVIVSNVSASVSNSGDLIDADGFKLTPLGKKRGRPLGCKNGMGTKSKATSGTKVSKKKKAKISTVDNGSGDPGPSSDSPGPRSVSPKVSKLKKVKEEKVEEDKECTRCKQTASVKVLVQCDACPNRYHFGCLNPPLKKSPKARGYDWFCSDCDSSEEEEESEDGNDNGKNGNSDSGSADSESDSSSDSSSGSGSSSESDKE